MTVVYILAAVLIFGLLVAVHELGHFLAAKLCGVRVNEFSIGMGPGIWSRQRGETLYSLRLFPVGGFCAMEGEDGESEDDRSLGRQGFWKQLLIFAAGSLMNLITGFVIVLALYAGAQGFTTTEISGTAPEFAENNHGAALMSGDRFWSINGERVYLESDVDLLLGLAEGQPMDLVVLRNGEKVRLADVPYTAYTDQSGSTYRGYGIYRIRGVEEATLGAKLRYSWLNTVDFVRNVRLSLQMLLTGKAGFRDLSGPVGIVNTMTQQGQEAQEAGGIAAALESVLFFGAMLAVNLAVMNLLPIPALDGGHILFLVVDTVAMALFGKKVPEKYEIAINSVCFVALMAFMLLVTFKDVLQIFR